MPSTTKAGSPKERCKDLEIVPVIIPYELIPIVF